MGRGAVTAGARSAASILLLVGGFAGCAGDAVRSGPPGVGDRVPAFAAATLAGDSVHLEQLGAPALVNLWATWCGPCRDEMPWLEELHRRYAPQGLRVVGISSDDAGAREAVERFVADVGVTFEIALDPRGVSSDLFRVIGLPASYLIDGAGTIRLVRVGPVSERDTAFVAAIESLLTPGQEVRP